MLNYFIQLWGLSNFILAIMAINKVKANKQECDFTWWWGFPIGAFVWEDVLVFSSLHAILALIGILSRNNMLWVLAFILFWVVRSAGETLYFFLQQFVVPKHHPHNISAQLRMVRRLFGAISDQKCFILLQVLMQSILVLSLFSLIIVLKHFSL